MKEDERFFQIDHDEIYYIIDNTQLTKNKEDFDDPDDWNEYCRENSLNGDDVVKILNRSDKGIKKFHKSNLEHIKENRTYRKRIHDLKQAFHSHQRGYMTLEELGEILEEDTRQYSK